jgi:tRNA-specific 2-thiouridylase
MSNKKKKEIVFVGLSGGVDSALSARLLLEKGYEVVGVFIKTWHPDFLVCNEEEERRDAMRIAAFLNIPFLTFDFEDVYKKEVADYMIAEYKAGRTPNPDVMCNKEVKFGAFLNKALAMGADFVATGHYARKTEQVASVQVLGSSRDYARPDHSHKQLAQFLKKAKDPSKDQVYFLWTLNQKQLSKILFPIGHLKKTEVRKLAEKYNLPVAEKKDSQGICFLGDIDLKDFLKHYIKEKKGKVVNQKGEEIGYHDGVVFHTLGERHGFTITKKNPNDGPYYVVAKNTKENILIVSQNRETSIKNQSKSIFLENLNWISVVPEENKKYTAQIRYHGEFLSCLVMSRNNSSKIEIIFEKPVLVASGQSIVLYDQDICLGGGVVV